MGADVQPIGFFCAIGAATKQPDGADEGTMGSPHVPPDIRKVHSGA